MASLTKGGSLKWSGTLLFCAGIIMSWNNWKTDNPMLILNSAFFSWPSYRAKWEPNEYVSQNGRIFLCIFQIFSIWVIFSHFSKAKCDKEVFVWNILLCTGVKQDPVDFQIQTRFSRFPLLGSRPLHRVAHLSVCFWDDYDWMCKVAWKT